ncbi:hypothetical protein [Pedobacter aquatilis]|uniref:hypothetical protein n=1 Tax=Pedobacter aquatilis TaxID=351343 RepID=UPI00292E3583|nr:hypothetical protein [Pedobacter aquatilis]
MTQEQNLKKQSILTLLVGKRMLTGALISLCIVSFFLIVAGKGNPGWGSYWQIKPLLLSPFLGSITGFCYDITARLRKINGWTGKLLIVLSLIGYFVGIWMSLVLGLAGTLWN